jgi:hypothetical protein
MQRRQVLKQIGASSAVAVGATGFASAQATGRIDPADAEYLTTEVNGERQTLTPEEFDQHPDTQSLSDVELSSDCCYECCECCDACCYDELCCCGGNCGGCSSC